MVITGMQPITQNQSFVDHNEQVGSSSQAPVRGKIGLTATATG
tara:strand:+ start:102 stop:230 length:129 start_codon:yes stop_codon:yes gene_type:complete